jgi:hypothetical protein
MADGTALQCGRVGSCHIYSKPFSLLKGFFVFTSSSLFFLLILVLDCLIWGFCVASISRVLNLQKSAVHSEDQPLLMHTLRSIFWIALWSFILLLSVYFFLDNVIAYFYGYHSRMFGDSLFHNQLWVIMHIVGGSTALLLGPIILEKMWCNTWIKISEQYPTAKSRGLCGHSYQTFC